MRSEDIEKSIRQAKGIPQNCDELLTKYGTYNIQPTADTENLFPAIAHSLPDADKIKKEIKVSI